MLCCSDDGSIKEAKDVSGDDGNNRGCLTSLLIHVVEYVQSYGQHGPIVYTGILAMVIVCCLPCTVFEILPGFLFGPMKGAIVCFVGKNLGSLICITLAKTLLSGYAKRNILPQIKHVRVLERFVKKKGFAAVCVFRGVVYAPLPIKNYGLGALEIPGTVVRDMEWL